jgi:hypothetical protein
MPEWTSILRIKFEGISCSTTFRFEVTAVDNQEKMEAEDGKADFALWDTLIDP